LNHVAIHHISQCLPGPFEHLTYFSRLWIKQSTGDPWRHSKFISSELLDIHQLHYELIPSEGNPFMLLSITTFDSKGMGIRMYLLLNKRVPDIKHGRVKVDNLS
jgi:hypothetical protein